MDNKDQNFFEIDNGNIELWIEQDQSICIKAITKEGDPVELSEEEANELIEMLQKLIQKLR